MNRYKIEKNGLVQGGDASYHYDGKNSISWAASVKVGLGWLAKTYSKTGILELQDPSVLQTKNLKVGLDEQFGQVEVKVLSQKENENLVCSLDVHGQNISGTVELDTTDEIASIFSANILASVASMNLNLVLVRID